MLLQWCNSPRARSRGGCRRWTRTASRRPVAPSFLPRLAFRPPGALSNPVFHAQMVATFTLFPPNTATAAGGSRCLCCRAAMAAWSWCTLRGTCSGVHHQKNNHRQPQKGDPTVAHCGEEGAISPTFVVQRDSSRSRHQLAFGDCNPRYMRPPYLLKPTIFTFTSRHLDQYMYVGTVRS